MQWIKRIALYLARTAQAISQKTGKAFGDCKTRVNVGLILIAHIMQFVVLDRLTPLTSDTVAVREGTILSAILVGQTVELIHRLFSKR